MAPHTTPLLTFDALEHVMSFSESSMISALMKTNRALHHNGAKYLLDKDYIKLASEHDVTSWMDFMMVERGYRFHYLRGLEFQMEEIPEANAYVLEQFFSIYRQSLRITALSLPHSQSFLNSNLTLVNAIARLSSLTVLKMERIGPLSVKLLRSPWIHLTRVALNMRHPRGDRVDSGIATDEPLFLLRNSMNSLTEVVLSGNHAYLRDDADKPFYDEVYPRVRTLELPDSTKHHAAVLYAHAFPNLRRLHFELSIKDIRRRFTHSIEELHEENIHSQAAYAHVMWNDLDVFTASLSGAYILALQCPIKTVSLWGLKMDTDMLLAVLQGITPRNLRLSCFVSEDFAPPLRAVLRAPCAARLESFEALSIVPAVLEADAEAMMVRLSPSQPSPRAPQTYARPQTDIIDTLRALPDTVTAIGLALVCTRRRISLRHGFPLCWMVPVEAYLTALDLPVFAARVRAAVPSARTVVLAIKSMRKRPLVMFRDGTGCEGFETRAADMVLQCGEPLPAAR